MLKKVYEKNELVFALLFIFLYCVTTIPIRGTLGDESIWMLISTITITVMTTAFITKYKLEEKYGLSRIPVDVKRFLYFIPLIILGTVNFWGGFELAYHGINLLYTSISMILIGYIEELLFRGFLFKAIEKRRGIKIAIVISSITFGIGHILNLVSQPGVDTLMQVIYAIALGFVFVYVFYKSKSLWPCIILHSVVNLTSKYGKQDINIFLVTSVITIICILYVHYLRKI